MNMIELYIEKNKNHIIDSPRYGQITYRQWLEREKALIESEPGRVAEIREIGNRVSLYANNVGEGGHDIFRGSRRKRRIVVK